RRGDAGLTRLPPQEPPQLPERYSGGVDRPAPSRPAAPPVFVLPPAVFFFRPGALSFSPPRLIPRVSHLWWITLLMMPPDPGSSLPAYLAALGETLSIALLGTSIAAIAALPVSLLAARNIVPSAIFRFPVRRFFDSIRGVDTLIWALVWINV